MRPHWQSPNIRVTSPTILVTLLAIRVTRMLQAEARPRRTSSSRAPRSRTAQPRPPDGAPSGSACHGAAGARAAGPRRRGPSQGPGLVACRTIQRVIT
eukprot:3941361-Rhodomonas_salina.2